VYGRIPQIELVSACDVSTDNLDAVSRTFGVKSTYTDYSEMLDNEDLDIVSIVTPSYTHSSFAVTGAQHGCNIFVEKPMAPTLDEADRMIGAAEQNNVRLAVDENWRWLPEFVRAKQCIDDGVIGEVYLIQLEEFIWWTMAEKYKKQSRFLIQEQTVHFIDLLRWLSNSNADSVYACTRNVPSLGIAGESVAAITVKFRNGAIGIVTDNFAARGKQYSMKGRIEGTRGSILLNWDRPLEVYSDIIGGFLVPNIDGEYPMMQTQPLSRNFEWPQSNLINATGKALSSLIQSIENGQDPPTSGRDNRRDIEIMVAAYESTEKGHAVILQQS
jgi:UDP-N-acetyl-2-amino-2-deoxyglucuronate dehydrogenase